MIYVCYADISSVQNYQSKLQSFCKARLEYVNSINFLPRKKQSICAWILLEKALSCNDLDILNFEFCVEQKGKWFEKNNSFYFSISHSKNIVCVALSDTPVAIDVEQCDEKLLNVARLFQDVELINVPKEDIRNLSIKWTERECSIKEPNLTLFSNFFVKNCEGIDYCISVASNDKHLLENSIVKEIID